MKLKVASGTWKPGNFNLSRSKNSLEFAPKGVKTWTKQEIEPKTLIKPGMLRYTTFQCYIKSIFSKFCSPAILECPWRLPFRAKIACTKTWRMAILTWTKPGNNLEFYG